MELSCVDEGGNFGYVRDQPGDSKVAVMLFFGERRDRIALDQEFMLLDSGCGFV